MDGRFLFSVRHVGSAAIHHVLSMYVGPTIVASLLYCKLAKRFGSGRRWLVISCLVLAAFGEIQSPFGIYNLATCGRLRLDPTACIGLAQCVVPLAIGWWFLRRTRNQGRLQLAT